MTLSLLLAAAIALWGHWFQAPPISVVDQSQNPSYANVYVAAWAEQVVDGTCIISVGQTWQYYSLADQISILAHEVGHCPGLEHECEVSVDTLMCQPQIGAPTVRDMLAMWDTQGTAPYRLFVPVTFDGE